MIRAWPTSDRSAESRWRLTDDGLARRPRSSLGRPVRSTSTRLRVRYRPVRRARQSPTRGRPVAFRERRPATVRRLFNALNYVGRGGADATDWADEPKEPNLLNGPGLTSRTKTMALPR